MKAEDILPDNANMADFAGLSVRKGTIAAFISNAQTFTDKNGNSETRKEAEKLICTALPALDAIGVFEVFQIADAELSEFIRQARATGIPSA